MSDEEYIDLFKENIKIKDELSSLKVLQIKKIYNHGYYVELEIERSIAEGDYDAQNPNKKCLRKE
jgi:hypothetical protein